VFSVLVQGSTLPALFKRWFADQIGQARV